jgi:hypothetical protein
MLKNLKNYCQNLILFSEKEIDLIDNYFEIKTLKKKEFLLQDNAVCNFIAFISEGSIRHFDVKNGDKKTCDISFQNMWVTDFQSFTHINISSMNLQAMEDTTVIDPNCNLFTGFCIHNK